MLKAILLFIKAHSIATAITTTVVVTTAVATPIVVDNYKIEKSIEANIGMLAKSDYSVTEDNSITTENVVTDNTEPLTFRIEKVDISSNGGNIVTNMKGEDAIEMSSNGTEYRIIPSYDKDISEWTKAEKEEYIKIAEKAKAMADEEHEQILKQEQNSMSEAMNNIAKEQSSWSDYYTCGVASIKYNSYTKKYDGTYSIMIKTITDGGLGATYDYETITVDTTAADFRNNIYPILLQEFQKRVDDNSWLQPEINEYKSNLDKLYHLSD